MTDDETPTGVPIYHALSSTDGGATWKLAGSWPSASRDGALHAAFPEKEDDVQYVAVASSFWQPVTLQSREVRYVRKVKSLAPVGQLTTEEPPLEPEEEDEEPTAGDDVVHVHGAPVDEGEIPLHEPEPVAS